MTANGTPAHSPRRHVAVELIALALTGTNCPSYAQQVNWGQKSALLDLGICGLRAQQGRNANLRAEHTRRGVGLQEVHVRQYL